MHKTADVAAGGRPAPPITTARAPHAPAAADTALTVRDVLSLPTLAGAEVVAGERGLDRPVRWVNIMEVPDILPWVKPHELLVTTGFALRHPGHGAPYDASAVARLVDGLVERDVSALGVKSGRYLDDLPQDMLDIADRHGFPVLVLPYDVAFDEVISEVFTQLLGRQAWALDVADRLHRSLTSLVLSGGDLPQIASEVAELFDTAVVICTPDGRVQTCAGSPAERAALEALPLYDVTGRMRTERLRTGVQTAPGRPGTQLAVAPIVAAGANHGSIVASASAGGLGTVALQALERAATVAALVITKQLAVSAVESKFRGDFLREALTGAAGAPHDVVLHSAQLGWDVDRPLAVVVATLDEPMSTASAAGRTPIDRLASAWQQTVRARDTAAPVVGFTHEIVALLPATPETLERVVADVVRGVTGDRGGGRQSFSTGVSRLIHSVADLPTAYAQATTALRVGRRTSGSGSIAHFDDLGVQRILSLVSASDELRSFAGDVLGGLDADTAEMRDLRATLRELIDRNCNIAATARALHFHYNTLRYRIVKLESMVGPFTTDARVRLDVALALQVLEMRGL
jgi:purine catabolism regulator